MTQGQIMLMLREIECHLGKIHRPAVRDRIHVVNAQMTLCNLIEGMLADEQRATGAHRMSELPFDGQTHLVGHYRVHSGKVKP